MFKLDPLFYFFFFFFFGIYAIVHAVDRFFFFFSSSSLSCQAKDFEFLIPTARFDSFRKNLIGVSRFLLQDLLG